MTPRRPVLGRHRRHVSIDPLRRLNPSGCDSIRDPRLCRHSRCFRRSSAPFCCHTRCDGKTASVGLCDAIEIVLSQVTALVGGGCGEQVRSQVTADLPHLAGLGRDTLTRRLAPADGSSLPNSRRAGAPAWLRSSLMSTLNRSTLLTPTSPLRRPTKSSPTAATTALASTNSPAPPHSPTTTPPHRSWARRPTTL
jgi:hypothetical protein